MSKISHGLLIYLSLLNIYMNFISLTYFLVSYGKVKYSQSIQQMHITVNLQHPHFTNEEIAERR